VHGGKTFRERPLVFVGRHLLIANIANIAKIANIIGAHGDTR